MTLGLGIGWRASDFQLTGRDFGDRGRRFDKQLRDLQKAWAGEPLVDGTRLVGPPPVQQPEMPLIIGGTADASIRRAVEFGTGWTAGGLPPDAVGGEKVQSAWTEADRDGRAKIVALAYFSLGDTLDASRQYLLDYYQPMGNETAETVAGSALRSPIDHHCSRPHSPKPVSTSSSSTRRCRTLHRSICSPRRCSRVDGRRKSS